MKCEDCNAPTEVLSRQIGMFGKTETYCRFCRSCIAKHAKEGGFSEGHALALYDACTQAIKRGDAARAEALRAKAGQACSTNPPRRR